MSPNDRINQHIHMQAKTYAQTHACMHVRTHVHTHGIRTIKSYRLFQADIKSAFTSKTALLREMISSTPAENTNIIICNSAVIIRCRMLQKVKTIMNKLLDLLLLAG